MACGCLSVTSGMIMSNFKNEPEEGSVLWHLCQALQVMNEEHAEVSAEPELEKLYRQCEHTMDAAITMIASRLYQD